MKTFSQGLAVLAVVLILASPAFADVAKNKDKDGNVIESLSPTSSWFSGAAVGAGLGAGLTIIGAGYGFGRIGGCALESMARQPEVAPRVQTAMIVIAALLEGATFFSLIVCILIQAKATF